MIRSNTVVVAAIGLAIGLPAAVLYVQRDPAVLSNLLSTVGFAQDKKQPAAEGQKKGPPAAEQRPPVAVAIGKAVRKDMPVRLDAIGTVQAMATVTIRSRVDSQIVEAAVVDGAVVKEGDVLFRLDARQLEAQLKQAESNLNRDRASLVFAQSELKRQEELARRDFASEQKLETARSNAAGLAATVQGDEAAIDNLKVQLTYYTIRAPISGRIGAIGLKAGNIARSGDAAPSLATLIQVMPIYVTFTIPQRYLPDIRTAMKAGTAKVTATPQGYTQGSVGTFAFVDNVLDSTTGTISVRAIFENNDELLWPGALCAVRTVLRTELNVVAVPREAIQSGQTGNYLFTVENGLARVKQVTIDREIDGETVITGLNGNETVVTDGQLLLSEGARVVPRNNPGGKPSGGPPQADEGPSRGKATL